MVDTGLAFEHSEAEATLTAAIDAVRMNRIFGALLCLLGIGICFR